MFQWIKELFGTAQTRRLKGYRSIVTTINRLASEYSEYPPEKLQGMTESFKKRIAEGESLDNILPEAYACVKAACEKMCGHTFPLFDGVQEWNMIPYDVQLLGAITLHYGDVAEMQTGEGKTLSAIFPAYLNALTGKPVHLITVNEYLARRDCEWNSFVLNWLGISVSYITNSMHPLEKQRAYKSDIVYGTASEFGFDYLRDNSMISTINQKVSRGYFFAIIDEADSILIDEARTPLIISGKSEKNVSQKLYQN